MATVNPTITDISGDGSVKKVVWVLTSTNSDGAPFPWSAWADRTISFVGTWGGATAAFEGNNEDTPTTWVPIADGQGTAISKTANAIETAIELTQWCRPNLTTVGSGASITCTLIARRAQPLRT